MAFGIYSLLLYYPTPENLHGGVPIGFWGWGAIFFVRQNPHSIHTGFCLPIPNCQTFFFLFLFLNFLSFLAFKKHDNKILKQILQKKYSEERWRNDVITSGRSEGRILTDVHTVGRTCA